MMRCSGGMLAEQDANERRKLRGHLLQHARVYRLPRCLTLSQGEIQCRSEIENPGGAP